MVKRLMGVVLAGLVMCSAATLSAHDEYRIIGTVVKITATQIDVKQMKDGKTIRIVVDKQTKVTKDKKPAAFNQIKAGGSVVVEALGDSLSDLQALEIRLVPAIAATQKPK
jgi:hypothetical protein